MEYSTTIVIAAPAAAVIDAFFDPDALAVWWHVARSVCIPKPLGSYAVEWDPTEWRDPVLGRLGGAFRATVMEFRAGREFFLADAWWLPPDGDPIGPMALEVSCRMSGPVCRLQVRQTGFEETPRWRRYYAVIAAGWKSSLAALKEYSEHPA